jgi:hypothetical protein
MMDILLEEEHWPHRLIVLYTALIVLLYNFAIPACVLHAGPMMAYYRK